MAKEYHVFTNTESTHEQAFIFEVERTYNPNHLELCELWMITKQNTGEIKTRIYFNKMIESILENVGGNINDNGLETISEIFKDLLPKEKLDELKQLNKQNNIDIDYDNFDSTNLINCSEFIVALEHAGMLQKYIDNFHKTNTTDRTDNE